jgi:hypothetical protein
MSTRLAPIVPARPATESSQNGATQTCSRKISLGFAWILPPSQRP